MLHYFRAKEMFPNQMPDYMRFDPQVRRGWLQSLPKKQLVEQLQRSQVDAYTAFKTEALDGQLSLNDIKSIIASHYQLVDALFQSPLVDKLTGTDLAEICKKQPAMIPQIFARSDLLAKLSR